MEVGTWVKVTFSYREEMTVLAIIAEIIDADVFLVACPTDFGKYENTPDHMYVAYKDEVVSYIPTEDELVQFYNDMITAFAREYV